MTHPPGPPDPFDPGQERPTGEPRPAPANPKAPFSLLVGITTLLLSWCGGLGLLGLVAVYLGVKARAEIARSAGTQSGDGIALAGIITGAVAAVVGLAVLVAIIALVIQGNAAFQELPELPG